MLGKFGKNPRYTQSTPQSVELLRLVVPQISKYQLSANPINYAVWYEYYCATNLPLNIAMDERISQRQTFTNELLASYFETYIAPPGEDDIQEAQVATLRLITSLSGATQSTDSNASSFQHSLQAYGDQLESATTKLDLPKILQQLIDETRVMQHSLQTMRSQMAESQREMQELRSKLDQATAESLSDVLTGLANRKAFATAFEQARAQAQETHAATALLMLDIDHFKRVNDTYGHIVGDKVIRLVADILTTQIKGQDTACRFGGEEFTVLLPNTALVGAQAIAEKIRHTVEKAVIRRANSRESIDKLTISIGIAQYRPKESLEAFIDRADAALYRSKQNGRNRVTVDPSANMLPA